VATTTLVLLECSDWLLGGLLVGLVVGLVLGRRRC
jgi:hypothetical protein